MKYPANTGLLAEARLYARESIEHTFNYDGWEDAHKKLERIVTGKFAQIWVSEYCRINGIPCEKDASSPLQSDESDLAVNGWRIDCKASTICGLERQIGPHYEKQNGLIDAYCFIRTDRNISFIEPLGFIQYSRVPQGSHRIEKGQEIPGTKFQQRFSYSYFVKPESLADFCVSLDYMSRHTRAAA